MASSSDQKEVSYKDIQGYIHDVSPVKIPANPRSNRYFDFKFQQRAGPDESCLFQHREERSSERERRVQDPHHGNQRES